MIAQVIINSNVKQLNKEFDYNIPERLKNKVHIGSRILIPFGRNKKQEGFVIAIKNNSEFKVKDILDVEDEEYITKERINLAEWMARRYFCNVSDCIKLMLPPGTTSRIVANRIKERTMKFANIIDKNIEEKEVRTDKQKRVLKFLRENGETLISDLECLTDSSLAVIKNLYNKGYIKIEEKQVERNPFINKKIQRDRKLELNIEQKHAYNYICTAIVNKKYEEFLLFGVTGSGKTEIYLQVIEKVLNSDKTSIMLVPEISLTPQTVNRFIARFGAENIAVLHSKLSMGERFDQWNRIKCGKAKIVIGARSALFAPIDKLGLIIIDEEHDSSYKSEMSPRYHAKEVSRKIAKENNIPLILGSATPELGSYYRAEKKEICLLELKNRANRGNLPEVEIVDLKKELANGNRSMISVRLYEEIRKNLEKRQQTILFLNRRGYSTFVICRDCGYTAKCKNCNISMTYHSNNILKCHYCGYEMQAMSKCPNCDSKNIKYYGTGTQKLEEQIKKIFPQATTIRMDIDTVSKKNSHEEILEKFKNDNIDILIGTQMVVKGHHFPNVTLVGVVSADGSLNLGDYRATERTFQILTQVAGRAGRDKLPGKVIIQTYEPENYCIELAKKQNYIEFYNTEIALRKQLKYPPFCDIIIIGFSGTNEENVIKTSKHVHNYLKEKVIGENMPILLYSAIPAPIDKIKNKYRWRILIKCKLDDKIISLVNSALKISYKLSQTIRTIADIDPSNMM